jgi:hypothetical protein
MRIFKAKWFTKFAEKAAIEDGDLKAAAEALDRGESSADDLGGNVFKLRFARPGEGKRGGYRFILFFRQGERLFFRFAYAKSELDNISDKELRRLKRTAKTVLSLTDKEIEEALKDGAFKEIGP